MNCEVSDWGGWGSCSHDCGHGVQLRTRSVTTQPLHGGTGCGDLNQTKPCSFGACGCSNVFCKFEQHGLFGVSSIQVGHHKEEQKGTTHVCGLNPTTHKCECFCGKKSKLGTFEQELDKRGLRGDVASTRSAALPSRQSWLRIAGRRALCEKWALQNDTLATYSGSNDTTRAVYTSMPHNKLVDACAHPDSYKTSLGNASLPAGFEHVQWGANKDSSFLSQLTWGPVVSQAEAAADATQ